MNNIDIMNLEAKLLRGKTVQFERLIIKPKTLGEIEELGVSEYFRLINLTTLTKEKIVGKKLKEVFEKYSFYQIVVNYDELRELYLEFIRTFVLHDEDENSVRYEPVVDTIFVTYKDTIGKINNANFEDFLEFMRFVYHITIVKKESEREDIDEEMAELLKEFEEVEEKITKDKGNEVTLTSMIEAICVKHNSLNLFNIWDYTMYQFIKTYYRIEQIDNSNNIMTALYTGNIDSKKIDIKDYHWAKKLV